MKVAIWGAGPSGLMAAEVLLEAGVEVHIFDKMASPARKFLLAGRGGLNLTHAEPFEKFLTRYHDCPNWFLEVVRDYTPENLRGWADQLGAETFVGSSGRVFPRTMKASPLLRAWLKRLSKAQFHFKEEFEFKEGFDATLLAMGGGSWPKLGSDARWVQVLRDKNIKIYDLKPANCGFEVAWSPHMAKFAGMPLKGASFNGILGEAMITKNGLEGGAIYGLSNALSKEIELKGEAHLQINLKPQLKILPDPLPKQSFATYCKKLGLTPLAVAILYETGSRDPRNLVLKLQKPFDIDRAISSRGGVDFAELTENLELKKLPNVFVAGEMLNFDAPTGGYLLQAAFASGLRAARGIISLKE